MKDFNAFKNLPESAKKRIDEIASVSPLIPGVIIIHDLSDWSVAWMSERGLESLGLTLDEITALTAEQYYKRYFNDEDAKDYVPKILGMLEENNDDNILTFFQQVRYREDGNWNWHMSSTKILTRDDTGKPLLTITVAIPIDAMHHMTTKATRLLDENNFLRSNFKHFSKLSKREREVLKLMALGRTSSEIASNLFISGLTADTHRRNIRNKLGVNSSFELAQYARAFDLI